MDPVSCVSSVSWTHSVNAAETHVTVHWKSGMRYHVPTTPSGGPSGRLGASARAKPGHRHQRLIQFDGGRGPGEGGSAAARVVSSALGLAGGSRITCRAGGPALRTRSSLALAF